MQLLNFHCLFCQDETSIQFLAYVLGEKNVEVVSLALETLKLLSDTQRHRQKLAAVFGVLEALQATADGAEEFYYHVPSY